MPNLMRRAAVTLAGIAAIGGSVLAGTPAHASTSANPNPPVGAKTSDNWAGYFTKASTPIMEVNAQFTIPATASCKTGFGNPNRPLSASMWAGVGGADNLGDPGAWLEQAGVMARCADKSAPLKMAPFWEVVASNDGAGTLPPEGFNNETVVHPGDTISVEVDAPAWSPKEGYWYFMVKSAGGKNGSDDHLFQAYWKNVKHRYTGQTAEVITEYPGFDNSGAPANVGLINLGTVHYRDVWYAAPDETTYPVAVGAIVLKHWTWYYGTAYRHILVTYPGPATLGDDGDSFATYYTGNW